MFKPLFFRLFSILLFFQIMGKAQVDVVYHGLVWSDEFTTNGAVDDTKWFHQTQLPGANGEQFNGELEYYTNRVDNSFVSNDLLNIIAKKETYTSAGFTKDYTSARLNSKFSFKYGRVDVRAKVPLDQGSWPAIWLVGKDINEPGGYFDPTFGTVNWPGCGEIDMMEHGIFPSQNVNYIQSTLHTPSSYGNSVNNGGIVASDLANNYHIYSMNWSPNQITFLLDGVAYYTYNPSVKNDQTWPFDKEQYILLNIALGGVAGSVPSTFTQTSMLIDYVRVYQNTTPDTEPPTLFTAKTGNIKNNSIELLLNATDNYGTLNYNVSYNGTNINVTGASGVDKSVVINNLAPNTTYNFTVTAADSAGNYAANSPITLSAKTTNAVSNDCSGTSADASQGSFSTGYNYQFQTTGTDVKFTFQLLDTDKTGVVAYLWKQTPFTEYPMTALGNNTFTYTMPNQTLYSTINYAVKFAFAGGLSVTKYYAYVVGSNCSLGTSEVNDKGAKVYPNPVKDKLHIDLQQSQNTISLVDESGKTILTQSCGKSVTLNLSQYPSGVYYLLIKNETKTETIKILKN
jgi:beta-glucanase (GH16 family)